MTRFEMGESLNLSEDLIPTTNRNRNGRGLDPKYICVHNTDNQNRGADALAHARYLINKEGDSGYGPTSWHYTVDDERVVKHLPLGERGMHAYASGNPVSIGIEMCMDAGGDWGSTVDRAARLVAVLCFDFGWNKDVIKQHHDFPRSDGSQKNCPSWIRRTDIDPTWAEFVSMAEQYLGEIETAESFEGGFAVAKRPWPIIDPLSNESLEAEDVDHGDIVIPEDLLSSE